MREQTENEIQRLSQHYQQLQVEFKIFSNVPGERGSMGHAHGG